MFISWNPEKNVMKNGFPRIQEQNAHVRKRYFSWRISAKYTPRGSAVSQPTEIQEKNEKKCPPPFPWASAPEIPPKNFFGRARLSAVSQIAGIQEKNKNAPIPAHGIQKKKRKNLYILDVSTSRIFSRIFGRVRSFSSVSGRFRRTIF